MHEISEILQDPILESVKLVRDAKVSLTHYTHSPHPWTLTFCLNSQAIHVAGRNPNISAVVTTEDLASNLGSDIGVLVADSPKNAFFQIHNVLNRDLPRNPVDWQINSSAAVHPSASVSDQCTLGRNVVIGANAVIEDFVVIGADSFVGPGAVIGARGVHNTYIDGQMLRVVDAGGVYVGERTEILANAVVQRSYFREDTYIGHDVRIGPLTNIGHGSRIEDRAVIAGGTQLAGWVNVGVDAFLGPRTVVRNHTEIGARADVKLGSVVIGDVPEDTAVSGNFAIGHRKHLLRLREVR